LTQSTNQFDFVGPDKPVVRPADVVALPHPGELTRARSRKIKRTVQASSELSENMTDSPSQLDPARQHHDKGLVIIAGYKFLLGLMFIGIGIGALHLLHKDLEDVLTQLAIAIRFNPESRIVNFLVDKASFLDDHMLRRIGALAFIYSAVCVAEGIGLYLEKAWGEYLTLLITASFLPWEIFEIIHRITWVRISLVVVNVAVFIYLFKLVVARRWRPKSQTQS